MKIVLNPLWHPPVTEALELPYYDKGGGGVMGGSFPRACAGHEIELKMRSAEGGYSIEESPSGGMVESV